MSVVIGRPFLSLHSLAALLLHFAQRKKRLGEPLYKYSLDSIVRSVRYLLAQAGILRT